MTDSKTALSTLSRLLDYIFPVTIFVARGGAVIGQFSAEEFEETIRRGEVLQTDNFWINGMDDWDTVQNYFARSVASNGKGAPVSLEKEPDSVEPPPSPQDETLRSVPVQRQPFRTFKTPMPPLPRPRRYGSWGALALVAAVLCTFVWRSLVWGSIALVFAALALSFLAMRKRRRLLGMILAVACPVAMFSSFALAKKSPSHLLDVARKMKNHIEQRR